MRSWAAVNCLILTVSLLIVISADAIADENLESKRSLRVSGAIAKELEGSDGLLIMSMAHLFYEQNLTLIENALKHPEKAYSKNLQRKIKNSNFRKIEIYDSNDAMIWPRKVKTRKYPGVFLSRSSVVTGFVFEPGHSFRVRAIKHQKDGLNLVFLFYTYVGIDIASKTANIGANAAISFYCTEQGPVLLDASRAFSELDLTAFLKRLSCNKDIEEKGRRVSLKIRGKVYDGLILPLWYESSTKRSVQILVLYTKVPNYKF